MAKKIFEGTVIKSHQKTIRVEIEGFTKHPVYSKILKRKKSILAHDEGDEAKVGDRVMIEETRPISLRKSFTLKKILTK
jgi:small subunit ribosomal protein S17